LVRGNASLSPHRTSLDLRGIGGIGLDMITNAGRGLCQAFSGGHLSLSTFSGEADDEICTHVASFMTTRDTARRLGSGVIRPGPDMRSGLVGRSRPHPASTFGSWR